MSKAWRLPLPMGSWWAITALNSLGGGEAPDWSHLKSYSGHPNLSFPLWWVCMGRFWHRGEYREWLLWGASRSFPCVPQSQFQPWDALNWFQQLPAAAVQGSMNSLQSEGDKPFEAWFLWCISHVHPSGDLIYSQQNSFLPSDAKESLSWRCLHCRRL